jgi:hypothetical protein
MRFIRLLDGDDHTILGIRYQAAIRPFALLYDDFLVAEHRALEDGVPIQIALAFNH